MKAPATTKADPVPLEIDEDKLAHALVARGLVTPEEIQAGRASRSKGNLLVRLVALGHLAPSQARRVYQELLAQLNQQIPGYELLEKLGQGSMGMVYKARQLSMNRLVAIKVLHPRLAQIAQALEHAHRRHLVHRDIKPANVILTGEGTAKLADLGLAREMADQSRVESEKGLVLGTPYYIAPEQIQGDQDIDIRADIYALGATLYHMITGQPPFPGTKVDKVLRAHLKDELIPPDHVNTKLSSGIGEVVEVMMAKDRAMRYQNPGTLLMDLECLLAGQAPKVARQQFAQSSLHDLAEGEREDEAEDASRSGVHPIWIGVLGACLGLSLILNLVLFLLRK